MGSFQYNYGQKNWGLTATIGDPDNSFQSQDPNKSLEFISDSLFIKSYLIPHNKGRLFLSGFLFLTPHDSNEGYQYLIMKEVFVKEKNK